MPVVPLGKWRALSDHLGSLDRQKQAFAKTHGQFRYVAALGVAPGAAAEGADPGGAVLAAVSRAADAAAEMVYVEARAQQRSWLRRQGFVEVMQYSVRPSSAPYLYIMARAPRRGAPPPPR
jgi:hypothetical protein